MTASMGSGRPRAESPGAVFWCQGLWPGGECGWRWPRSQLVTPMLIPAQSFRGKQPGSVWGAPAVERGLCWPGGVSGEGAGGLNGGRGAGGRRTLELEPGPKEACEFECGLGAAHHCLWVLGGRVPGDASTGGSRSRLFWRLSPPSPSLQPLQRWVYTFPPSTRNTLLRWLSRAQRPCPEGPAAGRETGAVPGCMSQAAEPVSFALSHLLSPPSRFCVILGGCQSRHRGQETGGDRGECV